MTAIHQRSMELKSQQPDTGETFSNKHIQTLIDLHGIYVDWSVVRSMPVNYDVEGRSENGWRFCRAV